MFLADSPRGFTPMRVGRPTPLIHQPPPHLPSYAGPLGCSFRPMPSRQERRKAERDAAKRAPAQGGAAGAAAARANVSPGGDWTTQHGDQNVLFNALGPELVKQRAAQGDREAQYAQGYQLLCEENEAAGGEMDYRSPRAEVGLAVSGRSPDRDACMWSSEDDLI